MSDCCQRYAECLVTILCSSRTVHWHTVPCTCCRWTAESRNARLSCVHPVASKQPGFSPVDYKIWAVMQHHVYHRQIHSVDELKWQLINVWCSLEQSIFDEAIDQWWGRHWACVHAKGGHFEYSLWTDNVDFIHICYIQWDLFDCYIFNYKIMPATLANTSLFILQGSALADLRYGGRFQGYLVIVNFWLQ